MCPNSVLSRIPREWSKHLPNRKIRWGEKAGFPKGRVQCHVDEGAVLREQGEAWSADGVSGWVRRPGVLSPNPRLHEKLTHLGPPAWGKLDAEEDRQILLSFSPRVPDFPGNLSPSDQHSRWGTVRLERCHESQGGRTKREPRGGLSANPGAD